VNNLAMVVTWQCSGSESIRGPFGHQTGPLSLHYQTTLLHYVQVEYRSSCLNVLAVYRASHLADLGCMLGCGTIYQLI